MPPRRDKPDASPSIPIYALVAQALRFLSRLPIPSLPGEGEIHAAPDLARLAGVLALAGALIGTLGGATIALALGLLHLPALPAAGLAVAVSVLVTGALHEDGLADTADGLGGGRTPAQRLEIMRDSRVGAFGVTAVALALILRVTLLAGLAESMGAWVGLVVIAGAALSRAGALVPLWLLPPARPEGLSASAGRPDAGAMALALGSGALIALALLGWSFGLAQILAASAAAFLCVLPLVALARRLIAGQTGDIAGAAQQLSEIGFLTILAARAGA
jgi:adenosylcobinamide-GDP ribazoletransferase